MFFTHDGLSHSSCAPNFVVTALLCMICQDVSKLEYCVTVTVTAEHVFRLFESDQALKKIMTLSSGNVSMQNAEPQNQINNVGNYMEHIIFRGRTPKSFQ
jgi:hypothetical protein